MSDAEELNAMMGGEPEEESHKNGYHRMLKMVELTSRRPKRSSSQCGQQRKMTGTSGFKEELNREQRQKESTPECYKFELAEHLAKECGRKGSLITPEGSKDATFYRQG